MTGPTYTCTDLRAAGLQVVCCLSCHAEATRGGQLLIEEQLPDGGTVRCCCALSSALYLVTAGYQRYQSLISQLPVIEAPQPAAAR